MQDTNSQARLFICDPVCVFPYGHNVPAMKNFEDFVGPFFGDVTLLGCKHLPEGIAAENGILREFSYYYNDEMPLPDFRGDSHSRLSHDDKVELAKADLLNFIRKYNVSGTDTICHPSLDFYSLVALSECADALIKCGSPVLMLRLIGVMENAGASVYAHHEAVIIALLKHLSDVGLTVKLAAETPRYAEYLAHSLNSVVAVAANIEVREQVPLPNGDAFKVICPGSARYDKGFLELLEIFSSVRMRDPELKIRFSTQILPDRDLKHQLSHLTKLYALPGVTLLPSKISTQQIAAMYDDADLVLLPYANDVYAYRGSAVFIEAMCAGRPVIAYDGSAFVDQIRFFGAGEICNSAQEMVNLIIAQSKLPPKLRYAKARQARDRFLKDLSASYRNWVL